MKITYRQVGDYRLPNLTLPEDRTEIGRYGRLRQKFLKEQRRGLYSYLLMSGRLTTHLAEIDQTVQRRMKEITVEMEKLAGVTEELKAADQMRWVGLKNNIRQTAEDMTLAELIYS